MGRSCIRNGPWRKAALAVLVLGVLIGLGHMASPGPAQATSDEKVYWIDVSTAPDRIMRSNLDGTSVELLVSENMGASPGFEVGPPSLAVDAIHGYVYWSNPLLGEIRRAELDGSNIETVLTAPSVSALALDPFAGYLYWAAVTTVTPTSFGSTIRRSALDGTGSVELDSPDKLVMALDVDVARGALYFGDEFGSIFVMAADGSTSPTLQYGTPTSFSKFFLAVWDLEIWEDGPSGTADTYWSTANPEVTSCPPFPLPGPCVTFLASTTIIRAVQTGTPETLFEAQNLDDVGGIAIDPKNDALYFPYNGGLGRSNLDGSSPTLLVENQALADVEIGLTELAFTPTATPMPNPVGGLARGTDLASLPAAEEAAGNAKPWLAAVVAVVSVAFGAGWFARRRLVG